MFSLFIWNCIVCTLISRGLSPEPKWHQPLLKSNRSGSLCFCVLYGSFRTKSVPLLVCATALLTRVCQISPLHYGPHNHLYLCWVSDRLNIRFSQTVLPNFYCLVWPKWQNLFLQNTELFSLLYIGFSNWLFYMFCSVWWGSANRTLIDFFLFGLGRTVKHSFGRSLHS